MNSAGGRALGAESPPCLEGRGWLHRGVPQPLGEAGGAEPARVGGSAQPPGSLLPAPEDAPGSINPPPRSHSQRQSQRATLSSWGAPGRGPPLWGPGNHRPPGVPTWGTPGGQEWPSLPGRGTLSEGRLPGPRSPAWRSPLLTRPPDIHAHSSWRPTSR